MDPTSDFYTNLRKQTKETFKAGLIDDAGEVLQKQITDQIDCFVNSISLDLLNFKLFHFGTNSLLEEYDMLFFDATYGSVDSKSSAVSILEYLIRQNAEYASISKVLIGKDIIDYAKADDHGANFLIQKVRKLPHVIYGGSYGTKPENIISQIQREGLKKGIEVRTLFPKGQCSPELLERIQPYISSISKNIQEQKELSVALQNDINGFKPTNDSEYRMIEYATALSKMLMENQHLISQVHSGLNGIYNNQPLENTADQSIE